MLEKYRIFYKSAQTLNNTHTYKYEPTVTNVFIPVSCAEKVSLDLFGCVQVPVVTVINQL